MTGSLAAARVAEYRDDGFLRPVRVMDTVEALSWRHAIEAFEALGRSHPGLPRPFEEYARANTHVVSTAAAALARHPAILDAVESLLGRDILCWMVELFVKEPHTDKFVSLHQDLTYWGLTCPDRVVTAWVALCDVDADNGAMRFVRGSHRNGPLAHHDTFAPGNLLSRGQQVDIDLDALDEVTVELQAGEMSLHHGLMIHGSGPNTSDRRRVAVAIRYVSPEVDQGVADRDYAMVVRGVNRGSPLLCVAPPSRDFAPESLALFEEITAAQTTTLAADAEHELSYDR